jgi:hypothetical protein
MRFESVDRQKPLVDAFAVANQDQLHHREESESPREAEDLPIIAEGRIDEAGGAEIEAVAHPAFVAPVVAAVKRLLGRFAKCVSFAKGS